MCLILLAICCCPWLFAQSTDTLSVLNNIFNKSCQKEKITYSEMNMFVYSFSNIFANNTELCEFRNEALFAIIDSDNLVVFLSSLKKQKSYIPLILYDLAHPLHDSIDVDLCIHRLKCLHHTESLEKRILDILETIKRRKTLYN